jgi:hypothetical protein
VSKLPPIPDYIVTDTRRYLLDDKGSMARLLVQDDIDELRLFRGTLEKFIEEEEAGEIAALAKHAEPDDGEFWAAHYPYQWQQIIGSQLRKSFVVSLVSLAEFHIGLLCRDVATVTEAKITPDDLKGPLFIRARKFLETFAQFEAPSQAEWEFIGDLYSLRNSIVHNAALVDVDRNSARIEAFMRKAPGLSVPSAGMLKMENSFCVFAFEGVNSFLEVLHVQYVNLCTRLKRGGC